MFYLKNKLQSIDYKIFKAIKTNISYIKKIVGKEKIKKPYQLYWLSEEYHYQTYPNVSYF